MVELNVNLDDYEEMDFTPIPAGSYKAVVVKSDIKDNRQGTGNYVSLTWEILDGEHQGRRLTQRITLSHTTAEAVRIGGAQLRQIGRAIGISGYIANTDLFHDRPAKIRISHRSVNGRSLADVAFVEPMEQTAPQQAPPAAGTAEVRKTWGAKK